MFVEQKPPPTRPNPQKNNLLLRRLVKAPWWLLAILGMIVYLYGEWSDDMVYQTIWNSVKVGIEITITVAVKGYIIALALGLSLALMRLSRNIIFYQLATFYVEVIRGIPTLVLVYWIALGVPRPLVEQLNILGHYMTDYGIDADLWIYEIRGQNLDLFGWGTYLKELIVRDIEMVDRAVAALAISYSAFLSEIFRAGIQSIDRGQVEAARSLGLGRTQTMFLIVLPQAIRIILPPLGNDFIAILKETSLVAVLGVPDITRRGQTSAAGSFRFFEVYNVVALTYLVLTLILATVVKLLEAYLQSGKSFRPILTVEKILFRLVGRR